MGPGRTSQACYPPVKTVLSALSRGIIGANRLIVARFRNVY